MKREFRKETMFRNFLALLYPLRCPICDEIPEFGESVCPECEKKLVFIKEPFCMKCGKPLEDERAEFCYDCSMKKHVFESGRALFVYQGIIRDSLYRFKYQNKREYAHFYARQTVRRYKGWMTRMGIEAIIPIPLHKRRKQERGYNQAGLYARCLGKELGLPVEENLLVRVRHTTPQKELSENERKNNLKKAFKCRRNVVQFKKILLVDDIFTTGSTMDAAAEVLKNIGIQKVYFVCISIGRGL